MYNNCIKQNANKLAAQDIPFLFWQHKKIKVIKSEVKTTIRHNDYLFEVYDHQTALRINNTTVKVYYDEADLSSVHLFSLDGNYITECRSKVRVHEGKAGQTDADVIQLVKQSKHAESIKTVIRKDTMQIAKNAAASTSNDFTKLLSPLAVTKEELNEAEYSVITNYITEHKNIDRTKIKEYEPVYTGLDLNTPVKNKYSKKFQDLNPSLEPVTKSE